MTFADYAPYAVMVLTALIGIAYWASRRTPPPPPTALPTHPEGMTMTLALDDGSIDPDDTFAIELVD